MGCSNSKIQDDDALLRCRERKRYIKLVIENRYSLAAAHVAYIEALRNIGQGIKQFTEAELASESSLPSSPTMASELAVLHDKSPSHSPFPSSTSSRSQFPSPLNSLSPVTVGSSFPHRNLDSHDSNSPASYASPLQANFMRSGGMKVITVEQRPPAGERGSLESFSSVPRSRMDLDPSSSRPATPPSPSSAQKTVPPPPQPSGSSWDFFNPFIGEQYPYSDHRGISHSPERDVGYLEHAREEEDIPYLEDGDHGERGSEQVHSVKKMSRADFVDPHTNNSEIADQAGANTDAFTPAPPEPFVEAKAQFTSEAVVEDIPSIDVEANEAETMKAAEKASALRKDKEVSGKEVILDSEQQTVFSASRNRNLLDSIKEIENWFIRACESGKEVSRMLEANKVRHHSSLSETKGRSWTSRIFIPYSMCCYRGPAVPVSHEPSSMALNLLTWHRSTSSLSSSSKTYFVSSAKDDLDDSSSDFVEDLCMISGSHASTLERLYAWEKKLYDEVKAEECIRRSYEKKCVQLRHQAAKGENPQVIDRTRAAVKDLHSRIRVGIHAVESVSMRIQKLRDDELQPQLVELIQGLIRMWEVMLECHQNQYQIIMEASTLSRPAVSGIFSSDSHRQATVHLGSELQNWYLSFNNWIGAQKAYVQALHGWLQKCLLEEVPDPSTKRRGFTLSPRRLGAPLVIIICTDWSRAFEMQKSASKKEVGTDNSASKKEVYTAMNEVLTNIKSLAGVVRDVCLQRDVHQNLQKKAAKDLGRKVAEGGKSDEDKVRYHKVMQQTNDVFLDTLQTDLKNIFESLTNFASVYMESLRNAISNERKGSFPNTNSRS